MALLTVQSISRTGLAIAYAAASASDTFYLKPGSRVFVQAKNSGGTARTFGCVPPIASIPGRAGYQVPSLSVSIPITTGDKMIGPITDFYADANGIVTITLSNATGITWAVVELP